MHIGVSGYYDQAMYRVDEGLAEARRLQHVYTLGFSLLFKCWVSVIINVPDEIPRHSDEMFNLGNEHGFPLWAEYALLFRGLWSTMVGQASEGTPLITEVLARIRVAGAVISFPFQITFFAEALSKLGRPMEGLVDCMRPSNSSRQLTSAITRPKHIGSRADLLRIIGEHAQVEQSYRRALAIAERQNAKAHQLRAAMSMARLWRDQGKRDEARDLLAPVYGWFTEGSTRSI